MRRTCYRKCSVQKPDESIKTFIEVLLRLQNEAEHGSAEALELLWWAGLNAGGLLMEIEARGSPEAQAALKTVAANMLRGPR